MPKLKFNLTALQIGVGAAQFGGVASLCQLNAKTAINIALGLNLLGNIVSLLLHRGVDKTSQEVRVNDHFIGREYQCTLKTKEYDAPEFYTKLVSSTASVISLGLNMIDSVSVPVCSVAAAAATTTIPYLLPPVLNFLESKGYLNFESYNKNKMDCEYGDVDKTTWLDWMSE